MSDELIHVSTTDNDSAPDDGLAILRRCLAKLSFAGMGLDRELDRQLDSLRGAIRQEASPDVLQGEIEEITRTLLRLEDATARVAKVEPDYAALLQHLAGRLEGEGSQALHQLRRQVENADAARRGELTVNGLSKLIASGGKGLFSRLFGSRSDTASHPEAGGVASSAELLHPLVRLLEQLTVPNGLTPRLEELRQRLVPDLPLQELPAVLDSTVDLMLDAASDNHELFEAFLLSLNTRLEEVYGVLAQSSAKDEAEARDCAELDRSLRDEVAGMRTSLESAASLEMLKSSVETRLSAILTSVSHYKTSQDERRNALQARVKQLEQQLRSVESETSNLRETLVEQRHRALTDGLTGLPNRTAYLERLEQEYARLRRYRTQLSLAVMDIDHFKRINDQYGHIAGDAVLKSIGRLIQGGVRKSDFVARFGGEEFVILMPETGLTEATKAVNKLRLQIQSRMIEARGVSVNVTASFGVADFRENDTTAEVFNRADRALYRAKERGRNQVCCELPKGDGNGEPH